MNYLFLLIFLGLAWFFGYKLRLFKRLSQSKIALLIPLYMYPNDKTKHYYQDVMNASAHLDITAIINPNNGDFDTLSCEWIGTVNDLKKHKVTILGYVYTNYTKRSLREVEKNISSYESLLDIEGIFFDEVTYQGKDLKYYQSLRDFLTRDSKTPYSILNPGMATDAAYILGKNAPATQIVIFENSYDKLKYYTPKPNGTNLSTKTPRTRD
ncbi:MAG: spherulation-specific family 4 protein [Campylobacterota bacterium]|nr:spherulation-specific family 4 protein [Campylobacterota bacterium]